MKTKKETKSAPETAIVKQNASTSNEYSALDARKFPEVWKSKLPSCNSCQLRKKHIEELIKNRAKGNK